MYQVLSRISHRGLLLLGLSLASLTATAAPLTLEWVTTNVGVVKVGSQVSTDPQMITAIQSFSATLELRDDRLLTDGVFFERPPLLLRSALSGLTPYPPSYERRSQQITLSVGPLNHWVYAPGLGSPVTYDLFSIGDIAPQAPGNCIEAFFPCYIIDLKSDPTLGINKFRGAVSFAVRVDEINFMLSPGLLFTFFAEDFDAVQVDGFDGYWQVAATKVPLPTSLALVLLGSVLLVWAKQPRSATAIQLGKIVH